MRFNNEKQEKKMEKMITCITKWDRQHNIYIYITERKQNIFFKKQFF